VPDIKRPSQGQARSRRFGAGEETRLMGELDQKYGLVARFALATAVRRLSTEYEKRGRAACAAFDNGHSDSWHHSSISGLADQRDHI
jgi:hypothetical protein